MTKRRVNVLQKDVSLDGGFLTVTKSRLTYTLPTGEVRTQDRYVVDRGDAVAALLYERDAGLLHFVRQFRFPTYVERDEPAPGNGWLVELIAGVIDPCETSREAIAREISEETGFVDLRVIELIGSFYLSPGASNERLFLFFVEVTSKDRDAVSLGGGIGDEWIEIVSLTPAEFLRQVEAMEIFDAKTIAAAEYVRRRGEFVSE